MKGEGNVRESKALLLQLLATEPERYVRLCPCCRNQTPDSLEHLLLYCPRWCSEREKFLSPILQDIESILDGIPSMAQDRVALLLGGEYRGRKVER